MGSRLKKIQLILLSSVLSLPLFSLEFGVDLSPEAGVLMGLQNTGGPGVSVGLGFSMDGYFFLGEGFSLGPEFNLQLFPFNGTSEAPYVYSGGIQGNYYFFPSSRLRVDLGVAAGLYQFENPNAETSAGQQESYSDLWYKVQGQAGFRFSPSMTLAGQIGYTDYLKTFEPGFFSMLTAGVSLKYTLGDRSVAGGLDLQLEQQEPLFPLVSGLYQENPLGFVQIENNLSAEIRDVEILFQAGNYTSSSLICGTSDLVNRRGQLELPLVADFSETVQNFTEQGQIPGEVTIRYTILGESQETSLPVVLDVYNRNTMRWTDPYQLASFVSPTSPEVLDYSKYIVGIARNNLRSGLNRPMQFAMYLLEGLKVGGISYSADDQTPYQEYHLNPELIDYIQYPFQTLAYHSGDLDDLGLLYAASLESVGITAGLIPLANDFLVGFSLDITPDRAESLFDGTDNLLIMGDQVWIVLSMSVLREGFINSWYIGIDTLMAAIEMGEPIELILLQQAWTTYPPSGISGGEAQFQKPQERLVIRAVETDLMRYITTEFGPKIQEIQEQLQNEGGSIRLYNRLGLLYVRAGLYDEARAEFAKSVALGSVSARVNLGNIAFLERDYEQAAEWYQAALQLNPDHSGALRGWDKVQTELEEQ